MRTTKPPSMTPITAPGERCATQVIRRADARKLSATSTEPDQRADDTVDAAEHAGDEQHERA